MRSVDTVAVQHRQHRWVVTRQRDSREVSVDDVACLPDHRGQDVRELKARGESRGENSERTQRFLTQPTRLERASVRNRESGVGAQCLDFQLVVAGESRAIRRSRQVQNPAEAATDVDGHTEQRPHLRVPRREVDTGAMRREVVESNRVCRTDQPGEDSGPLGAVLNAAWVRTCSAITLVRRDVNAVGGRDRGSIGTQNHKRAIVGVDQFGGCDDDGAQDGARAGLGRHGSDCLQERGHPLAAEATRLGDRERRECSAGRGQLVDPAGGPLTVVVPVVVLVAS